MNMISGVKEGKSRLFFLDSTFKEVLNKKTKSSFFVSLSKILRVTEKSQLSLQSSGRYDLVHERLDLITIERGKESLSSKIDRVGPVNYLAVQAYTPLLWENKFENPFAYELWKKKFFFFFQAKKSSKRNYQITWLTPFKENKLLRYTTAKLLKQRGKRLSNRKYKYKKYYRRFRYTQKKRYLLDGFKLLRKANLKVKVFPTLGDLKGGGTPSLFRSEISQKGIIILLRKMLRLQKVTRLITFQENRKATQCVLFLASWLSGFRKKLLFFIKKYKQNGATMLNIWVKELMGQIKGSEQKILLYFHYYFKLNLGYIFKRLRRNLNNSLVKELFKFLLNRCNYHYKLQNKLVYFNRSKEDFNFLKNAKGRLYERNFFVYDFLFSRRSTRKKNLLALLLRRSTKRKKRKFRGKRKIRRFFRRRYRLPSRRKVRKIMVKRSYSIKRVKYRRWFHQRRKRRVYWLKRWKKKGSLGRFKFFFRAQKKKRKEWKRRKYRRRKMGYFRRKKKRRFSKFWVKPKIFHRAWKRTRRKKEKVRYVAKLRFKDKNIKVIESKKEENKFNFAFFSIEKKNRLKQKAMRRLLYGGKFVRPFRKPHTLKLLRKKRKVFQRHQTLVKAKLYRLKKYELKQKLFYHSKPVVKKLN